jgi:hypothetical protein
MFLIALTQYLEVLRHLNQFIESIINQFDENHFIESQKVIQNMVVDHFTYSILAHYLWCITYGYQGLWGVRIG